jgi:RNA polymerase sigma-70 factor (ECF subfamily)
VRGAWDEPTQDPLSALRDGDPTPFERFVVLEAATLLGFFRRLGAPAEEAEDLAQETLLKLYRNAQRYEARESFSSFVFRVARNAWIDSQRRRSVRPERAAGGGGDDDPDRAARVTAEQPEAGAGLDSRTRGAALLDALGALPEGQRAVFELGALQELPYEEVSEVLGIPVGTVKSRMFHAVRRLRERLKGFEEEL